MTELVYCVILTSANIAWPDGPAGEPAKKSFEMPAIGSVQFATSAPGPGTG
jgi:hypothetical protein